MCVSERVCRVSVCTPCEGWMLNKRLSWAIKKVTTTFSKQLLRVCFAAFDPLFHLDLFFEFLHTFRHMHKYVCTFVHTYVHYTVDRQSSDRISSTIFYSTWPFPAHVLFLVPIQFNAYKKKKKKKLKTKNCWYNWDFFKILIWNIRLLLHSFYFYFSSHLVGVLSFHIPNNKKTRFIKFLLRLFPRFSINLENCCTVEWSHSS